MANQTNALKWLNTNNIMKILIFVWSTNVFKHLILGKELSPQKLLGPSCYKYSKNVVLHKFLPCYFFTNEESGL